MKEDKTKVVKEFLEDHDLLIKDERNFDGEIIGYVLVNVSDPSVGIPEFEYSPLLNSYEDVVEFTYQWLRLCDYVKE